LCFQLLVDHVEPFIEFTEVGVASLWE